MITQPIKGKCIVSLIVLTEDVKHIFTSWWKWRNNNEDMPEDYSLEFIFLISFPVYIWLYAQVYMHVCIGVKNMSHMWL